MPLLSPLLFGIGFSERMTWQVASILIAFQFDCSDHPGAKPMARPPRGGPLLTRVKIQIAPRLSHQRGVVGQCRRFGRFAPFWRASHAGDLVETCSRSSRSSPNPSAFFFEEEKSRPHKPSGTPRSGEARLKRPMGEDENRGRSERDAASMIMPPRIIAAFL